VYYVRELKGTDSPGIVCTEFVRWDIMYALYVTKTFKVLKNKTNSVGEHSKEGGARKKTP